MTYQQLKGIFCDHEYGNPTSHLTGHVIFSHFGPDCGTPCDEARRTYLIRSSNEAFLPRSKSNSIYGYCLGDYKSKGNHLALLSDCMEDEDGGENGWGIEDCCLLGYLLTGSAGRTSFPPQLHYAYWDALTAMLQGLADIHGVDMPDLKQKLVANGFRYEQDTFGIYADHAWLENPDGLCLWNVHRVQIFSPTAIHIDKMEEGALI